ncbi:hypothetical protein [Nocardia tengchongensis]
MALRLFRDMSVPWTPGSGVEAESTDNPGRIKGEIQVPLDPPRNPRSVGFQALVDRAYRLLADTGEHEPARRAA